GMLDVERGGIVGGRERERRVAVGAVGMEGVEADAPPPPYDADVEVEESLRVASGEEDREEGDHGDDEERDREEDEDDVVRDGEQPLDEPEPSAHGGIELALDANRVGGEGRHGDLLGWGSRENARRDVRLQPLSD